jgi:hypothetical protein
MRARTAGLKGASNLSTQSCFPPTAMSRNSLEYRVPLLNESHELADLEKKFSFGEPGEVRGTRSWRRTIIVAILVLSLTLNAGFIVNMMLRHSHQDKMACLDLLEWYCEISVRHYIHKFEC